MFDAGISIITCFYNSTHRLPRFFAALNQLDLGHIRSEFVFVDNASTDGTQQALEIASGALKAPASVHSESKPGLMHARCTGVAAAKYAHVLFLDDDNEPAPDYVRQLARLTERFPSAAMITGNCVLPDEYRRERHLPQAALRLLVLRDLPGEFTFTLDTLVPPHMPWGAGMFARRAAFVEACRAWQATAVPIAGRTGGALSGGEDVWLAHYLTRHREPVAFSDRLRIVHRIDANRFSPRYLSRLGFANGLGYPELLRQVALIKPWLNVRPLGIARLARAAAALPLRAMSALIRPNVATLAALTSSIGYIYAGTRQLAAQRRRR